MPVHGIRTLFLSITLTALAVLALPAVAEVGTVVYEGTFAPRDLRWETAADGGLVPQFATTRSLQETGQPQLPVRDLVLLVPLGMTVAEAWVEPLTTHREPAKTPVAVAPPLQADDGGTVAVATLAKENGVFPANWQSGVSTHVWRGHRLLALRVHAARQIETATGAELEYLDAYAVRVRYAAASDLDQVVQRERLVPGESARLDRALQQLVANPDAVTGYQRQDGVAVAKEAGGFAPSKTPSLSGSPVSYLIITNEEMAPAFQALADHKTARGLPTLVVTREHIAANYRNGADIQETIRMFLQDAYAKWGVEYVLLGGDSDVLPPRYVENFYYPTVGSTIIPVEMYFSCLDGMWNANRNAAFGEAPGALGAGDLVDFADELYLGRAPVNTVAEAEVFVNKVIGYEQVAAGALWPNRALFAAEVLFDEDWKPGDSILLDGAQYAHQQVTNFIEPCTDMEYTRMYQTNDLFPWDVPLTRAALIDTLNNARYGVVNQIGHGYYFNMMVADANFMTHDASALTNGDHQFVLYALNCASAAFDNDCLMERFVLNPNGGAVAAIGSVRAAFPNNANLYQQEFFSHLYCQDAYEVGELISLSRLPYLASTATNSVDRWTFENYTLLGDPTLAMWSGVPQSLALGGTGFLGLGPQTVTVTVTAGGSPVADAVVCVNKDGDDYVTGVTDAAGSVALPFLVTSTGAATVTVSGKNLAQRQRVLVCSASAAYLAIEDMNLADDGASGSVGDGDGFIDAGETVALWPVLRETGGTGASSLTGTLSSMTPGVTVTTATATFPNVAAGGTTTAATPFRIAVDAAVVDGAAVTLQLDVTSGANHYLSEWTVTVGAPEVDVAALAWEDSTFGNDNGVIEAGERLKLTVDLKNYGAGNTGALTAKLRTASAFVTVQDSVLTWTDLGLLDQAPNGGAASLTWTDLAQDGAAWLLISDARGHTWRHDFTLTPPTAPDGISTNTSLGPYTIALLWNPSTGGGIYGYNVYRATNAGGPYVRANADVITGASYFRDDDLDALSLYYYAVAAVDSSRVESPLSVEVSEFTAPAEPSGFPAPFGRTTSGPLAVGDVDGDGDLEIVVAADQVYVWHHDGLELRDGDSNSQTLGNFTDFAPGVVVQPAAVTLAPLDDEPGMEMVVSQSEPIGSESIHVFTKDGTELAGWPRSLAGPAGTKWNWAAPAVGDIDGDGEPEIVVNTLNGVVWAWHADGTEVRDGDANPATVGVFYDRAGADWEWSRSGPSLYDLDNDGAKDIIFGTKNDASGLRRLMALRYDGTDVAGFPYVALAPIFCDIAVGDLDHNGDVELVFYDKLRYVYAVRQDGTNFPGFPVRPPYNATDEWVTSPALGDMDGDGQLEIVYAPNELGSLGRLVVLDTDYSGGTSGQVLPGWPVQLPGSSEGSPVIGDLDGDGSPEILHGIGGGDESAPYNLYAFHADGTAMTGFPITLEGPLMPGATIHDLDRDWDVDIIYAGWDQYVHVWDLPFAFDRHNVPWPTFKGDMARTGVILPLELVGVENRGETPTARMALQNPYPNPFNPSTSVRLYLATTGEVKLEVYDLQGRRIRTLHDGQMTAGWHTMVWDGRDDRGRGQASGMYFLRARGANLEQVQKATLVK